MNPADHKEPRYEGDARPDFAEGNTAGERHGANSERKLRPIVDELLASLVRVAPWTSGPVFRPTVERWAWFEAQAITYRAWFDERGLMTEEGEGRSGLENWDRAERRAASLGAELGLSPASLTRLLSGLSSIDAPAAQSGLEALKAAGAQLRLDAATAALPPPVQVEQGGDGAGQVDEGGEEIHGPSVRGATSDAPAIAEVSS